MDLLTNEFEEVCSLVMTVELAKFMNPTFPPFLNVCNICTPLDCLRD